MATGEDWSEKEVAATVADYMRMLTLELSGQSYNKTAHRQALLQTLDGRSKSSVEFKHQNISATLRDLGSPWIAGYKPLANYQRSLAAFVERWISDHPEFDQVSLAAVERPAVTPSGIDFAQLLVDAPKSNLSARERHAPYRVEGRSAVKRDYLAREARNSALGRSGELLALEYESFRLHKAGKKHLAERIEHVSNTRGDGLGYDILSFDDNGKERFIEVKTTAFSKETPFFASHNEISFARESADHFYLYRLFDFRKKPRLFSLQGDIGQICRLDPISYRCCFP